MMRRKRSDRSHLALVGTPAFNAMIAERERALGLYVSTEPKPLAIEPEPEPVVVAPVAETSSPAPIPSERPSDRSRLSRHILAWGEAHGWPELPLARSRSGVYLAVIAGETGWRKFVFANRAEVLRLAVCAIQGIAH